MKHLHYKCFTAFSGLVGLVGLEPMTPTMSTWCSNQLSYNPEHECYSTIAFQKKQVLFLCF